MNIRLQISTGPATEFAFSHAGPTIRLGRDPAIELALQGEACQTISWQHACIALSAHGASIRDLNSRNGTFVNDRRIAGACPLRAQDVVRLGLTGPRLTVTELNLIELPGERPATQGMEAGAIPERQQRLFISIGIGAFVVLLALFGYVWGPGQKAASRSSTPTSDAGLVVQTEPPDPADLHDPATAQAQQLADGSRTVLAKYCHRCHGKDGAKEGGFDYVLDSDALVAQKKIIPGELGRSKLYQRLVSREDAMPPEGNKRPSASELAVLKAWIEAGAPSFVERSYLGARELLTAIRTHLESLPGADRPFQRYLTLTHLYNHSRARPSLPIYRAGLVKLLNSLSWKPTLVLPQPVDREATVYALDLRQLDWVQRDLWTAVVREYPYGLRYDREDQAELRELTRQIEALSPAPLLHVRADWFIAMASRPPLYHTLLGLPETARELEQRLGVDGAANFHSGQLQRAGFTRSGISNQNRMIERHPTRFGVYWKSYDVKLNQARGDLIRFPLGPGAPLFPTNPFPAEAFVQDGGEILFNLPNGLQGYMLVDQHDHRIPIAPIEIVRDAKEAAGTMQIVNGLSCMACHQNGIIKDGAQDIVRDSRSVSGEARRKVEQLYPPRERMAQLLQEDERRFLSTMQELTRPYAASLAIEPISAVARPFIKKELGPVEAACELGFADARDLQEAIKNSPFLRERLGLGSLVQGHGIKRQAWEAWEGGETLFQKAARELRVGQPVRPPEPPVAP